VSPGRPADARPVGVMAISGFFTRKKVDADGPSVGSGDTEKEKELPGVSDVDGEGLEPSPDILESEGGGGKRTSLPPSTLASTIEEDIRTAGTEVVSLNDEERMVKVEDRGSA